MAVVGNFHLNSPLPEHRLSFVLSEHRLHFANIARIAPRLGANNTIKRVVIMSAGGLNLHRSSCHTNTSLYCISQSLGFGH